MKEPKRRRSRLQFGLPILLLAITALCLVFALPRFALGFGGLLIGTILALIVFAVIISYPVTLIGNWLVPQRRKPCPPDDRPDCTHRDED